MTQPAAPPPPSPDTSFKIYNKDGTQLNMPEDQAQQALLSGQALVPQGSFVPVDYNGRLFQVPPERFHEVVSAGGKLASQQAWEDHVLQRDYGDVGHGLEAFGYNALNTAFLDVPSAFVPDSAKESLRKSSEANPLATIAGKGVGIAAPIAADIFTGGALTPGIAAEGAEGVSALRLAGQTLAAPTRLVTKAGEVAEGATTGLAKLLGGDATSLIGKLVQEVPGSAIRAGTETALYGAADAWGEDNLKDKPELTGEKLWQTVADDFWTGAELGGVLGAGGILTRNIAGRLAPRIANSSVDHAILAIDPSGKLGEELTGREKDAVAREFIDKKVIDKLDTQEQIASKIEEVTKAKEGELRDLYKEPILERLQGVPADLMTKVIDEEIRPKFPSLEKLGVNVDAINEDISSLANKNGNLSFGDTSKLVDSLSEASKTASPRAKIALDEISGHLENFLDKQVESNVEFAKTSKGQLLGFLENGPEYKQINEIPKRLSALRDEVKLFNTVNEFAQKALEKKPGGIGGELIKHALGLGGGFGAVAGHAVSHLVPGAAAGVAVGAIAKKLIAERGRATAAVILDKLATIGAARRAALAADRVENRAWNKIATGEIDVSAKIPRTGEEGYTNYKRVVEQWEEKNGAGRVGATAAAIARHAPKIAQSFQTTAERSIVYLKQNFPQMPPDPSVLNPKWDKRQPSDLQKHAAAETFRNVTQPLNILDKLAAGTITPKDVQDVKATHPEIYASLQLRALDLVQNMKTPPSDAIQRALNIFLGKPPMDPREEGILQAGYATPAPAGQPGPGKGGKKSKGTSRPLTSFSPNDNPLSIEHGVGGWGPSRHR